MKEQNINKIEFFYENNLKVHIDCYTGRYYNGGIMEINQEKGFIILRDRVLGETPIMFEEIQNIEKMKDEVGE